LHGDEGHMKAYGPGSHPKKYIFVPNWSCKHDKIISTEWIFCTHDLGQQSNNWHFSI